MQRGSLTVEAVLIVPIIIFVLFWLVNIAFVLYQYAALQSIANQAVEAAQAGWDNTSKDIQSGRLESSRQLDDEWLYWSLLDREGSLKEKSLQSWTAKRIREDRIMDIFTGKAKQGNVAVEVGTQGLSCLRRSIAVKITDSRSTLFSPIRTMFGFDMTNQVVVMSKGTLQDPPELIRNLDWGTELYSEYINGHSDGKLAKVTQNIAGIREKCVDLLK